MYSPIRLRDSQSRQMIPSLRVKKIWETRMGSATTKQQA